MELTILIFGDIVGKIGRKGIVALLPELKKQFQPDLIIGNAENLAHGIGATTRTLAEVQEAGIEFFTSGNHIWSKKEILPTLDEPEPIIIRPANYPKSVQGKGATIITIGSKRLLIINLMGQVFFRESVSNPFHRFDQIMEEYAQENPDAVLVDFHAEATSEKNAFGRYVDGRATVVWGTHTHIPTADEQILSKGTAYITDVGMTGLKNSIIGSDREAVIENFLTQVPTHFHSNLETGAAIVNAMVVTIDPANKTATSIKTIHRAVEV